MNLTGTWRVLVPKLVGKIVSKFPQEDRERIRKLLREFEVNPWAGDIAKLKGNENKWRRRTGNYRIFYSVFIREKIVEILEIERRTSST
jgi:mRNA-degrading endonuclease RelE of RelBE toxin-antitoxin system